MDGTEAECIANGGSFQGLGNNCADISCPGACCLSFGCISLPEDTCIINNGEFQGQFVECTPDPCPQPCLLLGDMNGSGGIDGNDIAGFNRAKLGQAPEAGENQACADYGTGTLNGDIGLFVVDLLSQL